MSPLPAPISPWSASSSTAWGFQLDRIRSLIAIVIPLPSSESNVLPWLPIECCLILPVSRCPLSVDPFADILRTISELRSVGLGKLKEFHCVTIDEGHICEINSECARFLLKRIPEGVDMFTAEPSTYEQHDKAVSGIESIDSETHRLHPRSRLRRAIREFFLRTASQTPHRNFMKQTEKQ